MSALRNSKHEKFAQGCALLLPPAVAYRQAGYSDKFPGNGAKLFRNKRIQERIAELRLRDEIDIGYRRAVVRRELDCIAFLRLPALFKSGKLADLDDMSDEERAAISEISADGDGNVSIKAHPKVRAIELIMKLDGLAEPDKLEVSCDLTKLSDDELGQFERLARKAAIAGSV